MLHILKILLIIPLAIVELLALALCWILAIPFPSVAKRVMDWAINTLPDKEWYYER